jgi:ferrous iron transport protein A
MHGFMGRFGRRFRHQHELPLEGENLTLVHMRNGQRGVVVAIKGGHGMVSRLSALGIRPGRKITKVSAMFMRGPVTIQVDNAEVAIGFGMARRVIVKPS